MKTIGTTAKHARTNANKNPPGIANKSDGRQASNKMEYEGSLLNGMRHGRGIVRVGSQVVYEGEFALDKREGYGKYVTAEEAYFGYWKDDCKHGVGQNSYSDGTSYKGHFFGGLRQGFGMFTRENMHFTGFWNHNQKQGEFMAFCVKTGQALQIMYKNDDVCTVQKINKSSSFDESIGIESEEDFQNNKLNLKPSDTKLVVAAKIQELEKIIKNRSTNMLKKRSGFSFIRQNYNEKGSSKNYDQGLHLYIAVKSL